MSKLPDFPPSISCEIRDILNEWVGGHPRYGRIYHALTDAKLCHPVVYLGINGYVYHNAEKDGASIEHSDAPHAKYADPAFFEQVEQMLNDHFIDCNICQGLLLPTSI